MITRTLRCFLVVLLSALVLPTSASAEFTRIELAVRGMD
jgi:hypothetical protein